jgi:hypothetical protein
MKHRLGQSFRGATRLGFADIVVIALVTAILIFAAWKQFPAYNRPFKPWSRPTFAPRPTAPGGIRTPAPKTP